MRFFSKTIPIILFSFNAFSQGAPPITIGQFPSYVAQIAQETYFYKSNILQVAREELRHAPSSKASLNELSATDPMIRRHLLIAFIIEPILKDIPTKNYDRRYSARIKTYYDMLRDRFKVMAAKDLSLTNEDAVTVVKVTKTILDEMKKISSDQSLVDLFEAMNMNLGVALARLQAGQSPSRALSDLKGFFSESGEELIAKTLILDRARSLTEAMSVTMRYLLR